MGGERDRKKGTERERERERERESLANAGTVSMAFLNTGLHLSKYTNVANWHKTYTKVNMSLMKINSDKYLKQTSLLETGKFTIVEISQNQTSFFLQ